MKRNTHSKIFIGAISAILVSSTFPIHGMTPQLVHAAVIESVLAETTEPIQCDLAEKLQALKGATGGDIKTELSARKDLLSKIIDCSLEEVQETQDSLNKLKLGEDFQQIKDQTNSHLDTLRDYYHAKRELLGDLGLRGTQDTARQISVQRATVHANLAQQVLNLVFWSRNETLIATAGSRLQQISDTIKTLKIEDNESIREMFSSAQSSLSEARSANARAENILKKNRGDDPLMDIKQSLDHLAQVYQAFTDISKKVSDLLSSS